VPGGSIVSAAIISGTTFGIAMRLFSSHSSKEKKKKKKPQQQQQQQQKGSLRTADRPPTLASVSRASGLARAAARIASSCRFYSSWAIIRNC